MDSIITIALFVAGTILTIFGFFLKSAYNDTRKDIELLLQTVQHHGSELGRLKGKIELVEQESRLKYQAIQEQTQLEIKNLARHVSELSDAVKEFVTKKM
jgi:cell division protein FtsL